MRWMHLVLAASMLAWIGCGGAPAGDVSSPSAATGEHKHGAEADPQEPLSTPAHDPFEEPTLATEDSNSAEASTSPVVSTDA